MLFDIPRLPCPFRPSEANILGVLGLDAQTQHALFPSLPTADSSRSGRWKWSDIGTAPALDHFAQHAHSNAKAATCSAVAVGPKTEKQQAVVETQRTGGRDALNQERSLAAKQTSRSDGIHTRGRSCSPDPEHYLVALRWGAVSATPLHPPTPTPQRSAACISNSRNPSPPRFSTSPSHNNANTPAVQKTPTPSRGAPPELYGSDMLSHLKKEGEGLVAEHRFRSASPSVARACVTLPGFCPPGRGPHVAGKALAEEQHRALAVCPPGKHSFYTVLQVFIFLSCR